ncbi:MAG: hypothetical protein ACOY3P_08525 [Planctomycetota bacterium]
MPLRAFVLTGLLLGPIVIGSQLSNAVAADAEPAATPAPEDNAPERQARQLEIRRLLRRLDAAELAEREAAETALVELGPAALDFLPQPDATESPEVRQRLQRIVQKLQQRAAEEGAQPSKITLDVSQMPLSKVLAALSEQSGNMIVDYRREFGQEATDRPLTLRFKQTPFWSALDQMLDQAELTVYPYGPDRGIYLVARGDRQYSRLFHAAYAGPFRIEAAEILAKRDLRREDGNSLMLNLDIAWEPRLKPIGLRQRIEDLEAFNEERQPLRLASQDAELEVAARADTAVTTLVIPFELPDRRVQRLASLRGKLRVMLPGKTETFRFDKLKDAQAVEKRQAGVTVTLDEVRKNNDLWQVYMRVRYDEAGDALQSHRGWIFQNEAYLVDPQGKQLPYDILETTRQTENEVGIAYGFVLDGSPEQYEFVYQTPGALVAAEFDYQLKDIKLP